MPYKISQEGSKWCVYKKNSDGSKGKLKGCSDSEEKAKAYMRRLYQVENEKSALAEMPMVITKASRDKKSGAMRLRMVNSDTSPDIFDECMSLELFHDFVERSDSNATVPEPFDSVIEKTEKGYWMGGPPYLSIAHYKSGAGKNVPGKQEKLYIDGEKLKSVDVLDDTPLGNAVWKSVYNDLYEEDKSYENPVRVSIGFIDLEHMHKGANEDGSDFIFARTGLEDKCQMCEDGVGDKVYLKGHLVHKAFTRVPANERTLVEVDEMTEKSDGIVSKKDDARSIIEELADELEEKSAYDDVLVVKADEGRDEDDEEITEEAMSKREDVSPADKKRAEKEYGDVKYADEKNKKYPIDTEEHIRAAWNYIGQKRNQAKYSASEVASIKKKIAAAWRSKIDKAGPPSASQSKSEAIMDTENEVLENEPVVEEEQVAEEEIEKEDEEVEEEKPVVKASKVEKSAVMEAAIGVAKQVEALAKEGHYGNSALENVQPFLNQFGEVIKSTLTAPAGTINEDAIVDKVVEKLLPSLSEMIAKSMAGVTLPAPQTNEVVTPRSISLTNNPALKPEQEKEMSQIDRIARTTSGL